MPGSYRTVPSDFSDILRKSFATSVARYTSRRYHFQFQRGSDNYVEILMRFVIMRTKFPLFVLET